jgi:hypothetical protein
MRELRRSGCDSFAGGEKRQVVTVEVDPREVDALIERGYMDPKDRGDLEVLGAAVTAFFSDALVTP